MSFPGSPSARTLRPPSAVLVLASPGAERAGIARTARELGYRAIEADDPFEVLRMFRERPATAKLLLVQVRLPLMDGGEVIERAKDLSPALRTVFLSNDPVGADAVLIAAYPEVPVLETPAERRALAAVLRAALGRGRITAPAAHPGVRRTRPSGHHAGP